MSLLLNTFEAINPSPYGYQQQEAVNLEGQLFKDHINIEVNVEKEGWGDKEYLSPNERAPDQVKGHLDLMDRGLIVSTGTERSFYDLILSPEDRCTGLVTRDINPKVKAYNDFLILLLRVSSSREDFCKLAAGPFNEEKRAEILRRLTEVNMPHEMRGYYVKNFDHFANIYYPVEHRILSSHDGFGAVEAKKVDYWSDDICFNKLKSYADAGKIVSTIGDIGDLQFINGHSISIVDTSNIGDYFAVDVNCDSYPRIIWNAQFREFHGFSRYRSYVHEPLIPEQKDEMDELFLKSLGIMESQCETSLFPPLAMRVLIRSIANDTSYGTELYQDRMKCSPFKSIDPFRDPVPFGYSKTSFKALEMFTRDDWDGKDLRGIVRDKLRIELSE